MATKSYGDRPRSAPKKKPAKKRKPTLDEIATKMGQGSKKVAQRRKKK